MWWYEFSAMRNPFEKKLVTHDTPPFCVCVALIFFFHCFKKKKIFFFFGFFFPSAFSIFFFFYYYYYYLCCWFLVKVERTRRNLETTPSFDSSVSARAGDFPEVRSEEVSFCCFFFIFFYYYYQIHFYGFIY